MHASKPGRDRYLQAIALFKFLNALLFLLAALGAYGLMQQGLADQAREWGSDLAFGSGQNIVRRTITLILGLDRSKIAALGLFALFYAALFATEGVGLWRERRWAEYLTVIATGSLIPLEIYEVAHRPEWIRIATLVINVVVVAYLIVRLRNPRRAPRVTRTPAAAATEPATERSTVG